MVSGWSRLQLERSGICFRCGIALAMCYKIQRSNYLKTRKEIIRSLCLLCKIKMTATKQMMSDVTTQKTLLLRHVCMIKTMNWTATCQKPCLENLPSCQALLVGRWTSVCSPASCSVVETCSHRTKQSSHHAHALLTDTHSWQQNVTCKQLGETEDTESCSRINIKTTRKPKHDTLAAPYNEKSQTWSFKNNNTNKSKIPENIVQLKMDLFAL